LGSFLENWRSGSNFWATTKILTKKGLGNILGDIFTNSSGHPALHPQVVCCCCSPTLPNEWQQPVAKKLTADRIIRSKKKKNRDLTVFTNWKGNYNRYMRKVFFCR
jgi:hypothetical protein